MKLTPKMRSSLPSTDFAVPSKAPGSGSYPLSDASHGRNALARVSEFGSPDVKAKVRSAVKRKFPNIDVMRGLQK